ncbi:MAG: tRNA lysidine(34) synthetase TilS [Oscillospiraceae bacterium]
MGFLENVRSAVADYKMLEKGDAVVAALSGGADSVSLLFALKELSQELGITVSACHINHHLRGVESDSDMRFCEELCRRLEIPLAVREADVMSLQQKHESLEECARRVRYDFFAEVSAGKKLATAHTVNDSTETTLLNLMRGTGLKGLCGIPPVRGNIVRPLIYCTRAEVEDYCRSSGMTWVTDKTNLSTDYTRNKVRHIILPEMLKINGSLYAASARMQKSLREDSDFLEDMAAQALRGAEVPGGHSAAKLAALPKPVQSRAIKLIFAAGGIEPSALRISTAAEILAAGRGKFNPCRGRFFVVKRGVAFVEQAEQHYRKHEKDKLLP